MGLSADASRVLDRPRPRGTVWDPESGARSRARRSPRPRSLSIAFSLDATRILSVAQGGVDALGRHDSAARSDVAARGPFAPGAPRGLSPDGTPRHRALDGRSTCGAQDPPAVIRARRDLGVDLFVQFSRTATASSPSRRNGSAPGTSRPARSRLICGPDATQSATGEPASRPLAAGRDVHARRTPRRERVVPRNGPRVERRQRRPAIAT